MMCRILLAIAILSAFAAVPSLLVRADDVAEDEELVDEEPELSLEEQLARSGIPNADGSRVVTMPGDMEHGSIANVFAGNEFLFGVHHRVGLPFDAFMINRLTGGYDYNFEFGGIDPTRNVMIVKSDYNHVILIDLADGHVIDNPLARQERLRLVTTPWGLAFLCVLFGLLAGGAWFCLCVVRLIRRKVRSESRA